MSYTNVYPTRINWENEPSIVSPINATNLNKMDYALYQHDQTFDTWDVTKANQSDLLLSVKTIDYDTETGVFVFTWQNGTTKTVDLNIEKIPVSFSMSPQGVITMTTDDGTTYTADVGSLIKTYTFTDSSEIDFTVTTDSSGNKTITAGIVAGSITGSKLEPNYLANCQSAATSAGNSATAADDSAEDSEAWAVGTRDGVPVPSTDPAYENNSKYWATQGGANSLAGLSDTDITSPTDGQVLTYNSTSQKWENDDPSAGGGSTVKITTTETTLKGKNVTITQGTTVLTSTFDNSGVAVFTGVTLTGNVAVSTSDGTQSTTKVFNIPYFGNYVFTVTFFSATITVTFPYSLGATCTLSDGLTTLTADTSPMAFTVPNTGTWTATATLDGVSAPTQSKVITTDGQTESITIQFGTINLTYANEFRGVSISCVQSGTTITKTAPSSGNTMYFYPPSTGAWLISGVVSSQTYSTSATITSLSTPVPAELLTIPDGSTVTPTDDIQKWLNCAGIFDKTTYSSLSDILGDSVTFNALLGDSNANAYLARSTTFATTLCASQYAMNLIGQYDVCCDALLGNSTWASAIASSTYVDYVLSSRGLVPAMTSNTVPSGEASASGVYSSSYYAYYAFDNSESNTWISNSATNSWVQYEFNTAVIANTVSILSFNDSNGYRLKNFKILASNDNFVSDTHELYTGVYQPVSGKQIFSFTNSTAYKYYRLFVTDIYSTNAYVSVVELQFYGQTGTREYIHGATSEVAYYLDGATQVPISNPSTLDAGTYTFGSTIAKNPDSLSSDYTKQIRITPNTVEVVLRPDNALYWWGYVGNLETMNTANGWGITSGYSYVAPTHNKNHVLISAGNNQASGIGTKASTNATKVYSVNEGVTLVGSKYGNLSTLTSKSLVSTAYNRYTEMTSSSITKYSIDLTGASQNVYIAEDILSGRSTKCYALWYE